MDVFRPKMNGYNKPGRVCAAKRLIVFLLLLWWFTFVPRLSAQDQRISQMVHTSWTGRDGAPQAISALAQTPDGTLWIASPGGLFSFDGIKFEPFQPRPGSPPLSAKTIRFLLVSKEGDLCVFWFHGPPACIHQGSVRFYDRAEGEPVDVLDGAQQDSDANLWGVLNWQHLVRLGPDNIWHRMADPVAATGHISKIFIDSSDTQWVIENDLLYRRFKGQSGFNATGIYVYGPAKLIESPDHTLWVTGRGPGPASAIGLQHLDRSGRPKFARQVRGELSDILLASDDSLWISKRDGVLQRLTAKEIGPDASGPGVDAPDLYALKTGVTDVGVQTLLRDADGNIWVGGMRGLDRFEHANLVPAIVDSKVGIWFTCVDSQATVWIGNTGGQLFTIKSGHVAQILKGGSGTNLFCGTAGRAYFIQQSGISVVRSGHVRHLPLLPGFSGYGDHYLFLGVLEEPEDQLIAAVGGSAGHGLWKYKAENWSPLLRNLALPEVCAMFGSEQDLYVAFTRSDDTIGRIRHGSLENLSVPIRPIGFARTSHGIFVYGAKGIAVERDQGFQAFSFLHAEQATMVTGLVESNNGDLWLTGARGIVRIPAAEVHAALADPAHVVSSVNIREGDIVGPDVFLLFRHSAHIDPSGRLWFSTLNGVVSVDPDRLSAPRHPPLLSVRAITADGRPLSPNGTFPPDIQYLDIQYFGLDLTSPKDVVYRSRLSGLDTTWQDVGPRTEAIYTHLRPGSYTFQVMASNGNDVWTPAVSSVTFTILPHFYEHRWFQVLCVVAGAFLIWLGLSLRVRYVSRAIRIREEGRADERIRIARELHDTLLQGVQGLLLTFHVAAEKVPGDHESKKTLEKALATADRLIVEGRNRVSRLRSEHLTDSELKASIERFASDLNGHGAIQFVTERKGGNDSLQAHVVEEIFCIAREALTNAFRHSEALRIVVELDYQKRKFVFSCRDNGRGFDHVALQASQTNGHWGLRGMAERAEKIGAKFSYATTPSKGTDVHVVVPARRAYVRRQRLRLFSQGGSAP